MVSKASDDLPEPDRPVNTTSWSRGIVTSTFLRLCSRAPRMVMLRESRAAFWALALLAKSSFMKNFSRERRLKPEQPATAPVEPGRAYSQEPRLEHRKHR